jgi:hypothetical protein
LLGKPGKMDVQGHMVQDLFDDAQLAQITDYCRCDVLDTYFVFLRACVMLGQLPLAREQQLIAETRQWLLDRQEEVPAYATYLSNWGDWSNPWQDAPQEEVEGSPAPRTSGTGAGEESSDCGP